jgi:hypothetical protein
MKDTYCCNNEFKMDECLILEVPILRGVEEKKGSSKRSDITRGRDVKVRGSR